MNNKYILTELAQWAGGELVKLDGRYEDFDKHLAYCLSKTGEINYLRIRYSAISYLSPLSQLTSLQYLDCSYSSQVSDLSPLSQLTSLKLLYCHATHISDLSPLTKLRSLETLGFVDTQVCDL